MTVEPLQLSYTVDCPASHAFEIWTEHFGMWWPKSHNVSGPDATVTLEPKLGGRLFERTADGTEIDWGEITLWDPPNRFGYLWHIRRDRSEATDVEINFVATDDGKTNVEIVHTGWERLGDQAQPWRDANTNGWNGLLPHFDSYLARR
jgi:hypothetical protein